MMLEKVIYLSICYFTIATEMRFIEMEKNKKKKFTTEINDYIKESE